MSEEMKPQAEVKAPEEAKPEAVTPVEPVKPAPDHASEQAAVDEMQKSTDAELNSLKEAGNPENEKVINEAKEQLDEKYAQFRAWLKENTNPEKIKEEAEKFKDETVRVLNDAREKAIEVSNNPTFKETVAAGGQFLKGTGSMISEGFKYGYDKLMGVPEIKKVADTVSEKVDEGVEKLRHNKFLADTAEKAGKGFTEFSDKLLSEIKDFFDTDAENSSKK